MISAVFRTEAETVVKAQGQIAAHGRNAELSAAERIVEHVRSDIHACNGRINLLVAELRDDREIEPRHNSPAFSAEVRADGNADRRFNEIHVARVAILKIIRGDPRVAKADVGGLPECRHRMRGNPPERRRYKQKHQPSHERKRP